MAHPRTFRFGVQAHSAKTGEEWAARARAVESLGYSTIFVPDHFGDQLAPIPAMTAAAAATTTLRVGTLVHDNDYKHPVVLAKELASVDVLSGGRVEFGLGAGWMTTDYEQSGIPKDRDGVRISRMEESIAVYKGLFAPGPFSHQGQHYTITNLDGLPKPVQQPGPPLLIGAGGPRMLRIAARHAGIVGINPALTAGEINADAAKDAVASRVDEKVALVREAAGERFDDIELNVLVFMVIITDDREGLAQGMAPAFGLSPEQVMDIPYALFGTVDQICDQIRAARDRWGISYWVTQADGQDTLAPVVAKLAGT
jgi:probable F420-dependent oxidoreductase